MQPNTSLFFTLVVWELERMDGTFLQQGLIEHLLLYRAEYLIVGVPGWMSS